MSTAAVFDASALPYEPDVKSSDMVTVGIYFVVLTTLLFAVMGGLYLYFRQAAAEHMQLRIGAAPNTELEERRAADQAALGDIEGAIEAIAAESRATP